MNANQIFWPVIFQILITITGFLLLGIRKSKAVKSGNVDLEKTALDNNAWPYDVLQVSNYVPVRFTVFTIGFMIMTAMLVFAVIALAANQVV